MSIFSIRELYELRHIKRNSPRLCVGRLFEHQNLFGIKDLSGALWPIQLYSKTKKSNLKSGDILKFYGLFECQKNFKSSNHVGLFHVKKVLEHVKQTEPWKNTIICPPDIQIDKIFKSNTFYIPFSKDTSRFYLLSKKNAALERTKEFFSNRGFFYAETPTLVPSGGMETYLHAFQTQYCDHHGREWTLQLPTSPEFALKKLIAEGIPKIFQISRAFRNHGELSKLHEPEFMMLEWYRVGGKLKDILLDTQKLVLVLAKHLNSKKKIPPRWKIFHVQSLFLKILNLNLEELQNTSYFYENSKHLSFSICASDTWDDIFCKLFMEKIEPFLKKHAACFVVGYPMQMSALAAFEEKNHLFVQRGEAYLFGVEISNGYQELTDSHEFEKRFQKTQKERLGMRRDEYFENIMKFGLPPCAGNALGIERVIALLLDLESIESLCTIPFKANFNV